MSKKNRLSTDQVIVALDTPDLKQVKKIVKALHKTIPHFKVGSELYSAHGPEAIKAVRWAGGHVFLDLKYHDIPNTVAGAVREAAKLNIFMMTIHASGGIAMMEAARAAAEEMSRRKKVKRRPKIVGVTVLTSLSESDLKTSLGLEKSLEETVIRLANNADQAGLDGVVASGRELELLRSNVSRDMIIVVPGIRPAWAVKGDQSRIMTPKRAIELGANYLVIGRPITQAKDPVEAAQKVIDEICK